VDCVQWTGSPPIKYPDPADWDTITYGYDPGGRRIKKTVDDKYTTKYCYDGGNVIAEYDSNNNLLRKYIYGPGVDEPICMIDAVDNDAEYYYHYDGLGSVVALSDSAGDTVQTYEYSVYGQVAASEPDFLTNPYMFTGRRFDIETGLYYYRARYYNPYIGRFLQTDPVGYGAGINWYAYCGNNPLNWVDPSGLVSVAFYDPDYGRLPHQNDWFKEYADDFEHHYEMHSADDVLDKIEELLDEGIDVTEVYFFDHCANWEDYPNNPENWRRVYGLEFGNEVLRFDDGEMEEFATKLGDLLGPGAFYHFRHCLLGDEINFDHLVSLAEWTGGFPTAVGDHILPYSIDGAGQVVESYYEPYRGRRVDMPDYIPNAGYWTPLYDPYRGWVREEYVRPVWPVKYHADWLTY